MSTQRILSWDINSINQEHQEVMRSIDGGESTVIATLSATESSYSDAEVINPTTNVIYQVASVATIQGVETRVLSDTIEYAVPTIKVMSGETGGEMFMGMFTQPVELKIDGVVIPESAEEPGLYMTALDPLQPKPFTIRPLTAGEPLGDIYVEGGIGKVINWYPDGYSGMIQLGMNTTQVPAQLHPSITTLMGMFAGTTDFNDPNVSNWDTSNITNMDYTFNSAIAFNQPLHWTTTAVTSAKEMFSGAVAFNSDISDMNFTSITEMARMFRGATAFNQPVAGKFNLTNVTRPQAVFENATSFNQPIDWDFSNVIDLLGFFTNATSFNQDISAWNVSKVSEFQEMFKGATSFDTDLSAWDVSGGYGMTNMFADTTYLDRHDLSTWCVTHIPYAPVGFEGSATTTANLPVWGTCPSTSEAIPENVMYFTTTAGTMSYRGKPNDQVILSDGTVYSLSNDWVSQITVPAGKHKFVFATERVGDPEVPISLAGDALVEVHNFPTLAGINLITFNTNEGSSYLTKVPTVLPPNLTSLQGMFDSAIIFNQDISGWDTSHVTNMARVFGFASAFNQPLDSWDVSNVTDMYAMFSRATNFNQPLSSWNTANVTDMYAMFRENQYLDQDLSNWCVPLITSLPANFVAGAPLMTEDKLPVWGTCPGASEAIPENVMYFTTMEGTIHYQGTPGDVITKSDGTIYNVINTDTIDYTVPAGKHKVTLVVERVGDLKLAGEALTQVHNFPTISSVEKLQFGTVNGNSPNLVNVPTTLPANITNLGSMFQNATNFNQDISMWDVSSVTNMEWMFGQTNMFNQPLNSWNTSNVTSMYGMFSSAYAFDQPIGSWNVAKVTNMQFMLADAVSFNQDLSAWCVGLIPISPLGFKGGSQLTVENTPVWGTCPRGENQV